MILVRVTLPFLYLKKFPADVLKIDKTLIDYILTNKEDQRIVKAIIELGT